MAHKSTAQKTARRDDDRHGEALYSFSYDMDDVNYLNAARLVGPSRIQQIVTVSSAVFLLVIIASVYNREQPLYPATIAGFVLFFACGAVGRNWPSLRERYVARSNLAQGSAPGRRISVTAEAMIVEGHDGTACTYPLAELKGVAEDSDGALAKFGQRRYVYIPCKALSETRFRSLVKMLRERSG